MNKEDRQTMRGELAQQIECIYQLQCYIKDGMPKSKLFKNALDIIKTIDKQNAGLWDYCKEPKTKGE